MALAERLVKEVATRTPEKYAARVRWMAAIYIVLNLMSIAVIVAILWRLRFFITLSQRSNVETLTLAIVFVLAVYYIASTYRGFTGAIRLVWLNATGGRDREGRKQRALKAGRGHKYVCLDKAVGLEGKPGEELRWPVGDDAGKLGELVVEGVKVTYYPIKDGINNSLFEFLADQIEDALKKRDPDANLQITQWSTIDEDQASQYYSMVKAFRNLEGRMGGEGEIWPRAELTPDDVEEIGRKVARLVPALRNESLLPDVEYEVEYSVPVIPEPLGFVRLTRRESRADPIITMGCAGIVMVAVIAVLVLFIFFPPWVPSK